VPSLWEALYTRRSAERRATAAARARDALQALAALGVEAGVIGSLARREMRPHSDVDFLIIDEGKLGWNEITRVVERCMGDLPVDVLLLRWVQPDRRDEFLQDLVREADLREPLAPA
jgi:predicted nucleotidyltransferase